MNLLSIFFFIAVLTVPSLSFADIDVYERLLRQEDYIRKSVQDASGRSMKWIDVLSSSTEGSYTIKAYDDDANSTEVRITGVTKDNLEEKVREAITVLIAENKERLGRTYKDFELVNDILGTGISSVSPYPTRGAVIGGAPMYMSIWLQVPAIKGTNIAWLDNGRTIWMRTTIVFDGTLQGPTSASNAPVGVARMATTIWELHGTPSDATSTTTASIKLGTIQGAIRMQEADTGQDTVGRIDFDAATVSFLRAIGKQWLVRPYYGLSIRLGMRLLEASGPAFLAHVGADMRLGVILGDQFFIAGRLTLDHANTAGSSVLGAESGWRISKLITLKLGVDYSRALDNTPYDNMYLVPKGWSFNAGVVIRN